MTRKVGHIQVDGLYDQNGDPVPLPIVFPTPTAGLLVTDMTATGAVQIMSSANALDLATYKGMHILAKGKNALGGSASFGILMNGDTTVANYRGAGVSFADASTPWLVKTDASQNFALDVWIYQGGTDPGAGAPITQWSGTGGGKVTGAMTAHYFWNGWKNAANVTQVSLYCDQAGGIAIGTTFKVFRLA